MSGFTPTIFSDGTPGTSAQSAFTPVANNPGAMTQGNNGNINPNPVMPSDRLSIKRPKDTGLMTVLSYAPDNFHSKYELGPEIGKGGFSTVYQCREKTTGSVYAVKIVDLRPLKLRERFNPARLRREVDIMKRLRHPNIIQFIEVFETDDQLMMVMEYCPGQELFDVILARKFLSEDMARPIFAQVARALYYLHCLNIIHRDIKPENILILDHPDPNTGLPIAKILDFGLSKNAGAGSAAKTFVGTPCYLAPEVEYTSRGLGGTYGLPADCWSLGAVLYVTLVARFPEFEHDPIANKIVVKMSPNLWDNISSSAKDLIRSLMNTNPNARMTMAGALQHPWLERFRATPQELAKVANSCMDLGQHLQEEEARAEREYKKYDRKVITSTGVQIWDQAMVVRPRHAGANEMMMVTEANQNAMYNHVSVNTMAMNMMNQQHNNMMNMANTTNNNANNGSNPNNNMSNHMNNNNTAITATNAATNMTNIAANTNANTTNNGNVVMAMDSPHSQNIMVTSDQAQIGPLLHLQRNIAMCLDDAYQYFSDMPMVAGQVRKGAVLCRNQLVESTKMLRKVEQTATSVLNMFSDLELAVEEGEPALAAEFFRLVRDWVADLREMVTTTQKANHASVAQIQSIVEESSLQAQANTENARAANVLQTVQRRLCQFLQTNQQQRKLANHEHVDSVDGNCNNLTCNGGNDVSLQDLSLTPEQMFELFMNLFGAGAQTSNTFMQRFDSNEPNAQEFYESCKIEHIDSQESAKEKQASISSMLDIDEGPHINNNNNKNNNNINNNNSNNNNISNNNDLKNMALNLNQRMREQGSNDHSMDIDHSQHHGIVNEQQLTVSTSNGNLQNLDGNDGSNNNVNSGNGGGNSGNSSSTASPVATATNRLAEALMKLRQVDVILDQLGYFWAHTEVVLDALTKKGQHVEQFLQFSQKPKLLARFKERMDEYKRFWENILLMCNNYIDGNTTTASPTSIGSIRSFGSMTSESSKTFSP